MELTHKQPTRSFLFWLVLELFASKRAAEELSRIEDREAFAWLGMIGGAFLLFSYFVR